jgi:hypothetical protein
MDLRTGPLVTDETETSLVLPQGAKVSDMPRSAQGSTPFGDYRIETEVAGSTVRIKTSVTLKKPRIFAREYGAFRAFCEDVDRALSQSITFTVSK